MQHLSQHAYEVDTLGDDEKHHILYSERGCAVEGGVICDVERILEELNLEIDEQNLKFCPSCVSAPHSDCCAHLCSSGCRFREVRR